jgi:hypothetical protein
VTARLSYEPSVQAVLSALLPAGTSLLGSPSALRRRVSWPLRARTTGLGQIEGGEIVLGVAERAEALLAQSDALASMGVTALVLGSPAERTRDVVEPVLEGGPPLVLAHLPPDTDLRALQEQMERFIIRRRRELYELSQELYRSLIEGAIAGADVPELLTIGSRRADRPLVLDQEGQIMSAGVAPETSLDDLLRASRVASRDAGDAAVYMPGPPPSLALPVITGRERRGALILIGTSADLLDDHEVILSSLASACAIALGRRPVVHAPSLEDLLAGHVTASDTLREDASRSWSAAAVDDPSLSPLRLERVIAAELGAREARFLLARQGETVVSLVSSEAPFPWDAAVEGFRSRAGSDALRAGVSRPQRGLAAASAAARQSLEALQRGGGRSVTRYAQVEVEVLLASVKNWQGYVLDLLGPLLDGSASRRDLLDTLRIYLAGGRNATEAARQLKVHRNTLLYRLRRIEKLLDTDLERPADVFGLDLALRILAAHGDRITGSDGSG